MHKPIILSSATNGSQGMKRQIPIQILTFALFAIGGLIAIYQQYTIQSKPYAISHEDAVRMALNLADEEPNRDASFLFLTKSSTLFL